MAVEFFSLEGKVNLAGLGGAGIGGDPDETGAGTRLAHLAARWPEQFPARVKSAVMIGLSI